MTQEEELLNTISEALESDRLVLPTLPEVAMRVGQATQDENASIDSIAREIANDTAMAVRVLRVANSSALARGKKIEDLKQAVTRLGMALVRSLVTGLALEQLYVSKSLSLKARLRQCWVQSVEVAAMSQVLAAHCTILRPELAMLAGLSHEIGALPVIRLIESTAGYEDMTPQEVDRIIRHLQPRVGSLVLQAWDFPEPLIDVPNRWMDFSRSHAGAADYVDVVSVAALQSEQGRTGRLAGIDRYRVPAFLKLDLSPDVDIFSIGDLQQRYETGKSALQS